jgi:hypothetical protein
MSNAEDQLWLKGACRGQPTNWWFPLPKKVKLEHPDDTYSPEKAKRICIDDCPVRELCLEWALDRNEPGIWGGMTQRERRAFKKRRRLHNARVEQLPCYRCGVMKRVDTLCKDCGVAA